MRAILFAAAGGLKFSAGNQIEKFRNDIQKLNAYKNQFNFRKFEKNLTKN